MVLRKWLQQEINDLKNDVNQMASLVIKNIGDIKSI